MVVRLHPLAQVKTINPLPGEGKMIKEIKETFINGELVEIIVYTPSKRKADSSIQKPRYQQYNKGANWLSKEKNK